VPPQITTLRVEKEAPLSSLISQAEEATFAGLEGVIGGPWPTPDPAGPSPTMLLDSTVNDPCY
jgi:hypothetical protein